MDISMASWLIVLAVVVVALLYILSCYFRIKKMDEGTDEMVEMSGIIRSGASTFIKTEFKYIAINHKFNEFFFITFHL